MAYLNKLTGAYPLSEADIRAAHPNTSFTDVFVPPEDYVWVFPTPQPEFDRISQVAVLGTPVLTELEHYQETWIVTPRFRAYVDEEGTLHSSEQQLNDFLAAELLAKKALLVKKVDSDVDQIMRESVGERVTEYQRAEAQARDFKNSGYSGEPGKYIKEWAALKAWSYTQAADNILQQAEALIAAQDAMRKHRLEAKEAYRNASQLSELDTVTASWNQFLHTVRTSLGL